MKVGVLGSGDVAKTLAGGFVKHGHTVARTSEPLCMLWCIPGFLRNEWNHAFKLLRRE